MGFADFIFNFMGSVAFQFHGFCDFLLVLVGFADFIFNFMCNAVIFF